MSGETPNQDSNQPAPDASGAAMPVQVHRAGPLATMESGDSSEKRRMTRKEQAIMRAITDPSQRGTTNVEKIQFAGVAESTFYKIIGDPWFASLHRRFIASTVQANVNAILGKSIEVATTCGRDGATDRWRLLEYTGHYIPKQQVEHSGGAIVGVVGVALDQI